MKSELEYIESELANLALLSEYGAEAWEADNANLVILLGQAKRELAQNEQERDSLVRERDLAEGEFEKDLTLVETDLRNYINNNEKVLVRLKRTEQKAKQKYIKGENEKLDKLAETLLT